MDPDRALEALERDLPEVLEGEALADAELAHHVRNQTLFRLRMRTEARGELNRLPEAIHVILDRLPGRGADPDLDRESPFLLIVLRQRTMDSSGAAGRRHCRKKTGHDAVGGVLDLAASQGPQGIAEDLVMDLQDRHGRVVAMALREFRRTYDIREHDGADSGIAVVFAAAGKERSARAGQLLVAPSMHA